MIDKKRFLELVARQFEHTPTTEISMSSHFIDFDEWCSLVGLSIWAMIRDNYGVKLSLKELYEAKTVAELYDKVNQTL